MLSEMRRVTQYIVDSREGRCTGHGPLAAITAESRLPISAVSPQSVVTKSLMESAGVSRVLVQEGVASLAGGLH